MALPKEPRQKMINMMYLVLTALLALNVSAEILNAFKTVNNSIAVSNKIISDKNDVTYASFAEKAKDPQTMAKAAIWKPKADQVKKLSADMFAYIESVKKDLKKESNLTINDQGVEEFKEDNLDAAIRLMEEKGKGKELYNRLGQYRKDVLTVLNPEEFKADPILYAQIKKDAEAFDKSIPINLNVPKGQSGKVYSNDASGWTQNYFYMTPTIAGLTILSKFQNDVKNTESQLVDYLHQQIGAVKLVYNKFQAIAQANTSYAMPGDDIEITAGVGAFSEAAKPKITIGGQSMPLNEDGVAIFKTTASGTGDRSVNVVIEYNKPDGSVDRVSKEVKYTVGVPSGASVFLEKMNVMYIGVDNPITISGGSVGAEKTKVSFADGSITKAGGDRYIAKPSRPGMSEIVVTADGKTFKFPMRLKYLPPPAGFVGTKKGGNVSSSEFKAMGGVIAKLEESDFEAPYRVVSYRVGAVGGPIAIYTEANNEGNRWGGQAAGIISRCGPGTRVFIDNIIVIGPDNKQKDIPGLQFSLK